MASDGKRYSVPSTGFEHRLSDEDQTPPIAYAEMVSSLAAASVIIIIAAVG